MLLRMSCMHMCGPPIPSPPRSQSPKGDAMRRMIALEFRKNMAVDDPKRLSDLKVCNESEDSSAVEKR